MELLAYAVFDTKSESFNRPFFVQTDGAATRAIVNEALDPQSFLAVNAADYVLFCIGAFDQSTGQLSGFAPRNLGVASGLVEAYRRSLNEKNGQRDIVDEISNEPPVRRSTVSEHPEKHVRSKSRA